jgi:uncharacterized RDD family membrane protein YckC
MWRCSHCGEEVDDDFTECWNCSYSRDGKAPVREFTEKVMTDEEPSTAESHRKLWWPRLKAFVIDYALFLIIWGIIDNIVYLPLPVLAVELGSVVFFCLYFAVVEGRSTKKASWGKRAVRLKVVSPDQEDLPVKKVILRSAIVAAMVVFDWSVLFDLFVLPAFVGILAWTIPMGLILYNLWLAVYSPSGLMLQDRLTGTRVVSLAAVSEGERVRTSIGQEPLKRFPKPGLATGMIAGVSIAGLLLSVGIDPSVSFGDILEFPESGEMSAVRAIEKNVADEMGIRCVADVEVETMFWWSNSGGSPTVERRLKVNVWVPAVLWKEEVVEELTGVALTPLEVTEGFFSSGTLEINTGSLYIGDSRTFSLNMP